MALAEALAAHETLVALFTASWCPFCVRFLPLFQKLAQGRKESFLLVQDDREEMAGAYGVEVYPTVLLIRKGEVVKRLDGVAGVGLDEEALSGFLASLP
jgi:thioredoxin 1